ncbi:MAG TPA: hypothetical protein VNB95_00520, partial [Nitrososphaera sp.]|nr:hypothetical protein [Nitrososphaera sp.]
FWGVIMSVLGAIGPTLDAMAYSKGEESWVKGGKELARRINQGILGIHSGEPSPPVFKMVFNTL